MQQASIGAMLTSIPCQNILGENVLWHAAEQAIYWVDIEGCLLQRYQWDTAELTRFTLPQRMGSFGFLAPASMQRLAQLSAPNTAQPAELSSVHSYSLIAAFADGFALYHPPTQAIQWLAQPELGLPGSRFNDGRVSRQGEFFAGTMQELSAKQLAQANLPENSAALYRLLPSGEAQSILNELRISNGLCWSLDGQRLYHADSPCHQIKEYVFDATTGAVSAGRVFAETPENAYPDGSTVDAAGYLWNAHWGAGQVVRYRPNGDVDLVLSMPVSQPSSVAIGGPRLDLLFVTSSRLGLSAAQLAEQPLAGNLFIYQLHGIQGVVENLCTF